MSTLHTARLTLVPWPANEFDAIAALTSDRRVTRYLLDGEPWAPEFIDGVAEKQQANWDRHGIGWRIAVRQTDGAAIAMAASAPVGDGIADLDPLDHELGWWLAADVWRQGYGTEIGLTLRAEAHEVHGADEVIARLQPENVGSAGVATAIGLAYERDIRGRIGELNALYCGTAADWAARAAAPQA